MTYRDLPIHQRITAKANALAMNWNYSVLAARHHGSVPINLLDRVRDKDPERYMPSWPVYAIQFKTNNYDLPYNYNPHA